MPEERLQTDDTTSTVSPSGSTDATETSEKVENVHDGGIIAWSTVAGAWLVYFATLGYVYSFGVYQDFYTRVYLIDHSPSSIAWIGSFQLTMPLLMSLISGKLFDEGYFYALELTGGLIFVFSLFMLSLAKPHYYQIFLSQAIGMGIGLGLTFIPTVTIVVQHFSTRRALATGIVTSGGAIGAVVFPIMLNNLIPKIGFGSAVRATAYLVLAFLVAGNSLMRGRNSVKRDRISGSQPAGFRSFRFKFIDYFRSIRAMLRDVPYTLFVFGGLLESIGLTFPVVYMQLYANSHGINPTVAFYSLAIINGCSGIGRVASNFFADKHGPFNVLLPLTLCAAGTILAVLGVKSTATLVVVSALYGLFSGAYLGLSIAAFTSLARTVDEAGSWTGVALALNSLGYLVSAPIQGALLTSEFKWIRPIIFSACLVFAAGMVYTMARFFLVRQRHTQVV